MQTGKHVLDDLARVASGAVGAAGAVRDEMESKETRHRQVRYLNNTVEADQGKLKLLIRPVRGFKTLKTAYATIRGFEVMRALRKGRARAFAIQAGILGEARIVERTFGIGPCALTEAMSLLQDHLATAEAWFETSLSHGLLRHSNRFATEP